MLETKIADKVVFVVPPEVHLLDLSGPAHVFYEAKSLGAELSVHFVSLIGSDEITSSAGIGLSQLEAYEDIDLQLNDLIIIPGLEYHVYTSTRFISSISPFLGWLRNQYANGVTVCSVCTGSFLLAASGIADGKELTTHWKYADKMESRYSAIKVIRDRLFTENERLFSSAGVSSGIDLSLFLIEKRYGTKLASEVAREMVIYFRRGAGDPQLSVFLQFRNHIESRIHEVQNYMAANLSQSFKISLLAKHVNMSERNLTRLFKKTTGITIGEYHQRLRVEKAISLLQAGNPVNVVAAECGLKTTNQLRNILKAYKNILPSGIGAISQDR